MRVACLFWAQVVEYEIIVANAITIFFFSTNVEVMYLASWLQNNSTQPLLHRIPLNPTWKRALRE